MVKRRVRSRGASGRRRVEDVRHARTTAWGDAQAVSDGEEGVSPRVVSLTKFSTRRYVYAALQSGASGFCSRTSLLHTWWAPVRTGSVGDALLAPSITAHGERFARPQAHARQPGEPATLTLQRATGSCHGPRNSNAGGNRNETRRSARRTVTDARGGILAKLGWRNRGQAVVVRIRVGMIRAPQVPTRRAVRTCALGDEPLGRRDDLKCGRRPTGRAGSSAGRPEDERASTRSTDQPTTRRPSGTRRRPTRDSRRAPDSPRHVLVRPRTSAGFGRRRGRLVGGSVGGQGPPRRQVGD